jgi:hypothetical protein
VIRRANLMTKDGEAVPSSINSDSFDSFQNNGTTSYSTTDGVTTRDF